MHLDHPQHRLLPGSERFRLVTAGHHFLLKVLPFREPDSREALAEFMDTTERCQLIPPEIDAVLLRCLVVLNRHTDRVPSLVDRYLSQMHAIERPAVRFAQCVEELVKYKGIHDGTVQDVFEFVDSHHADVACTPQTIAAHVGVRLPTLCVLFRRQTGRTLRQYVREERLNHAAKLLATTNKSIKEIWAGVGYGHASNFDHDFKRLFCVTPRDYRAVALRPAAKDVYGPAQKAQSAVLGPTSRDKRSVLIVDDDVSSRWLVSSFLEAQGHEVRTAHSGDEGLRIAQQLFFDVILLDYHLGDMNGVEFLHLFRQSINCVEPPVVVFTADLEVIARGASFDGLNAVAISKLCDFERLSDVMARMLGSTSDAHVAADLFYLMR